MSGPEKASEAQVRGRGRIIIFFLLFFFAGGGRAKGFDLGADLSSRYVLNLKDESGYDFITLINLGLEERIGPAYLYLNPVLTWDVDDNEVDLAWEEAYLDCYFADFDLRVGKQKVTWGKADGLIVTNMVNPADLTEYPVVEFADKFQGIYGVNLNYYLNVGGLEVIWIPKFEGAKLDQGLFYQNLATKFPDPVIDYSQKKVERNLANSEFGVKYSSLGAGFDYELVAGYFWDDEPTIHKEERNDGMVFLPKHHRLTMVGASVSSSLGPVVLRGEGAYISGKHFTSKNLIYQDGVVEKDQLKLLLGGEFQLADYLLSIQILEEMILDYEEMMEKDRYSEILTFLISKDFFRNTLGVELFLYYESNQDLFTAQPKVRYDYSDLVNLVFGANYAFNGGIRDDVLYFQVEYCL